jgi:hypothetical protein
VLFIVPSSYADAVAIKDLVGGNFTAWYTSGFGSDGSAFVLETFFNGAKLAVQNTGTTPYTISESQIRSDFPGAISIPAGGGAFLNGVGQVQNGFIGDVGYLQLPLVLELLGQPEALLYWEDTAGITDSILYAVYLERSTVLRVALYVNGAVIPASQIALDYPLSVALTGPIAAYSTGT